MSQPDWAQTCSAVSHFAELVAAARDEGQSAAEASLTARQILNHPDILSPDVAAEITRQVYVTRRLTPSQQAASFRTRCLTPVQSGNNAGWSAADVLDPIKLNVGVNHVDSAEGSLDITLAWSNDGNGHGHDVFTAAMSGAGQVSMPDGDAVADDPADDQNMRRSVRFARGQVNGENAVILLMAQRDPGDGAVRTTYRMYKLVHDPEGYRFGLMKEAVLPDSYCNADAALSAASGLPLRQSYRGRNTIDGCPPRRNP